MLSLQQHINKIAELFFRLGGDTAVICPGSRDVPLIVAFARHKGINCVPVSDERSAAFIALGIAQQSQKPVAIICTSGTATLNFYPAICEAFYQRIPLIAITADRPPELIDQWDGQSIRQEGIYQNHILHQITIPDLLQDDSLQHIENDVTEAISLCIAQKLPVHINVPLREPFYPAVKELYNYNKEKLITGESKLLPIHSSLLDTFSLDKVLETINGISNPKKLKLLVVIGMGNFDEKIFLALEKAQQKIGFPIIADVISNYKNPSQIRNYDLILSDKNDDIQFAPEIVISIGGAMLSKNLKKFLRNHQSIQHFHIQPYGQVGNPFQTLTGIVRISVESFFNELTKQPINSKDYQEYWNVLDHKIDPYHTISTILNCEVKLASLVLKSLPLNSQLQLSNSMPVRYALIFGADPSIKINCNRGTSGIDGCSSTAVGAAFATGNITTLITGDIAFFYDVNAFWNKISIPNLRIIIFNNGGGGIFRLIDGPSSLEELDEFIENAHTRTAEFIARDFKFEYSVAKSEIELQNALDTFYNESERPKILEIFTNKVENEKGYKQFKSRIHPIAIQ